MIWDNLAAAKKYLRHALEDYRLLTPKLVSCRPEFKEVRQRLAGATSPPVGSDKILMFAETGGWIFQQAWLGLIAKALQLRGAVCDVFLCGGQLPVCHVMTGADTSNQPITDICRACTMLGHHHHEAIGLKPQFITSHFDSKSNAALDAALAAIPDEDLPGFIWKEYPLGKGCLLSAAYHARAEARDRSPEFWGYLRQSMLGAGRLLEAFEKVIKELRPTKVVLWNGLMFSQEPLIWLARRAGIPYVTVEGGWYPDTVTLCHNDVAAENCDREWSVFRDRPLSLDELAEVEQLLADRRAGQSVVSQYWQDMVQDVDSVVAELGLDLKRPIAVICSNITWDSAVLGKEVTFPSLVDWVFASIDWFAQRRDLQLVIRAHPAEVSIGGQRESKVKIVPEIERRYPVLPPNVRVVPSTSKVSTYILMELASLGLVLSSTAGLEMASTGKPVIAVGRSHYSGKGFTKDPVTPEEYDLILNQWAEGRLLPSTERAELAKRYIHLFIKKMMIPFPLVKMNSDGTHYEVKFEGPKDLEPGRNSNLDLICDGILRSQPFCLNFPEISAPEVSV